MRIHQDFSGARPLAAAPNLPDATIDDVVWLLGQPSLGDYLDFVRRSVVAGPEMDQRRLVDEWRVANDHYHDLEDREAGIADAAECLDLPQEMLPLADALAKQPHFRKAYDLMPATFGMVELDRLIAWQLHVTLPFVEGLRDKVPRADKGADLFRFCKPLERHDPPVAARRVGSRRHVFMSDSTDFRFQSAELLNRQQIVEYEPTGPVEAVLGLFVGFSTNFLSVIRSDNRMMLNNGYHRACALCAAGVTHAPAVIETVTRRDELAVLAPSDFVEKAAFYFKAARPPLIKDFFDPQIRKVLPVHRKRRAVELSFEVREYSLPAG